MIARRKIAFAMKQCVVVPFGVGAELRLVVAIDAVGLARPRRHVFHGESVRESRFCLRER